MRSKVVIIGIIIIIFLIIIFNYNSYGFYSSNLGGSEQAKVANFSLSIDESSVYFPYQLDDAIPTSNVVYYKFEVNNIKDNKTSEVKQKYIVSLSVTRNIPFDIELYKVDKDIYDSTTNTSFDSSSALLIDNVLYPNDVNIENSNTFQANVLTKDYYVIKVLWNDDFDDYIYQDKIDLFKINAEFEQIS